MSECEERQRLEREMLEIDCLLTNGWRVPQGSRLAELWQRYQDISEALKALDSDERSAAEAASHYDSNVTTDPIVSACPDRKLDIHLPYLESKAKAFAQGLPDDAKVSFSHAVCDLKYKFARQLNLIMESYR